MSETIMIIDGDRSVHEMLTAQLHREGYHTVCFESGIEAIKQFSAHTVSLIISEFMLPDIDGITVCQHLRKESTVPFLYVSSCLDEVDKIAGLNAGADDYVPKPFSPRELIARVKAHLRRTYFDVLAPMESPVKRMKFDRLIIYPDRYLVQVDYQEIALSAKEFQLLSQMARYPGRVFHPEELYQLVWSDDSAGDLRTVMVHISNLRKKIEKEPSNPSFILTVRGAGYKFSGRV